MHATVRRYAGSDLATKISIALTLHPNWLSAAKPTV